MQDKPFTIKTMAPEEVNIAIDWAAQEGWNPGLHDAETYYTVDPNGFFIGYLGDEPIAAVSAVKYGDTYGFIGLYIVKPAYRGKIYGIKMGRLALEYLNGRSIGVDGVLEKQENYKAFGFDFAYRNMRYEGKGGGPAPANADIIELSQLDFDTVDNYDRPFFPDKRSHFLKAWINQTDAYSLGVMQQGKLAGYGVMRPCRTGYKVGPLFADTPELADDLFTALKSKVTTSDPVFLDIPEVNAAALALVERHHMNVCFETARMYSQQTPALPMERIYGVTSFEIG